MVVILTHQKWYTKGIILKSIIPAVILVAFFSLVNNSDENVVMSLMWVDHNYENYPRPAIMASGEVRAGDRFDISYDYPGKIFICNVVDKTFVQFRTWSGDHRVICLWDGELIQVGEEGVFD